jgi:hypothetical protein
VRRSSRALAVSAAAIPAGPSFVEESRGRNPELEAQIRDAVVNRKALVKVDLNVGELIRNGKANDPLHIAGFFPDPWLYCGVL